MLRVHAEKNESTGEYRLKMKGHCGAKQDGKDLICAASSILCLTMAQTVINNKALLDGKPKVYVQNGKANITFKPKPESEQIFKIALSTVITGFKVLQKQYGEYITLI